MSGLERRARKRDEQPGAAQGVGARRQAAPDHGSKSDLLAAYYRRYERDQIDDLLRLLAGNRRETATEPVSG